MRKMNEWKNDDRMAEKLLSDFSETSSILEHRGTIIVFLGSSNNSMSVIVNVYNSLDMLNRNW